MIALVLLPGLDGTGFLFESFVAAIGKSAEVIVVSYPPDNELDYISLEQLVRSRLPDRPSVLLAESFSGPIAISIAASPPSGLRGLILSCSFARNPVPFPALAKLLLKILSPFPPPLWLLNFLLLGRFSIPMH